MSSNEAVYGGNKLQPTMALDIATPAPPTETLLASIDLERVRLSSELDPGPRADLGQFMTPHVIACQLASMLRPLSGDVRILDPGAGIGSLGAALVAHLLETGAPLRSIHLCAYEIAEPMWPGLERTVEALSGLSEQAGIAFEAAIYHEDFLAAGVEQMDCGLFGTVADRFDAAILNPPYRKIARSSTARALCERIGLETTNLYTAFLAVSAGLLSDGGQLAAIVPRSFTNGSYFRAFREWFGRSMVFDGFHVYESRNKAFADDRVLQENVLLVATKTHKRPASVTITSSNDPADTHPSYREVRYPQLIGGDDPGQVIHLVPDELNHRIAERVASLPCGLADLGLTVSTGRVVDFRATAHLRQTAGLDTVPLIYPGHLRQGRVVWPMASSRKPNALRRDDESEELLVPEGLYVLTKRFSAKEERRRIVAALYDPQDVHAGPVGFENHLNYFHNAGRGLDRREALGLRAYLNSSLVDVYFRQFSGHTQVNAGDLRRIRYPSERQLARLAERLGDAVPEQDELDRVIDEELFAVAGDRQSDPVRVRRRIDEAIGVLRELGLPRAQLNERSGLTLLALLNMGAADPWSAASDPLIGITPMMDYFREHYGKTYAPNTRETVRRQTVHQFLDAGLVVINPDQPDRPTNSPKAVYQIEASALELIQTYGTDEWQKNLDVYLASRETLRAKYAAEREMARIPVRLPDGSELTLSGGGQNVLVSHILTEFCPRWTPEGLVLYVGDTGEKFAHIHADALRDLGIVVEEHGKMPDLIVHDVVHGWLLLIEAVTSHGPVDPKRRGELQGLFGSSSIPLVYLTAFLDRQAMMRYLPEIAWETEVWCASDPTHLIHFNGARYLGPYDT
jgi:adenine-specific DNA-methyltransferase